MNRDERIKARQQKLQGIDAGSIMRKAAVEMDALAKHNARVIEVDAKHDYGTRTQEIFYIEERASDGSWRAYSLEDINGQGCLDVRRADRENLEPALRWDMAGKLVRGATFNEPRPAIEFVRDHVRFISAGTIQGKVM